ncbi:Gfo/Idh/MocA family protein [Pseudonocardia pini]|uniref:Gfo/Idh/MocA family protein n=1 Tax=Pseudonocardia pini TaxID=2758030 RepID=UPI0015EFFA3C|nr:Gfo/Idh/MocA family oxidoreductase [Pseudonocardia pini]
MRIGVVGAGIMGTDHVRTLHGQVSGAEVGLVADLDPDRAAAAVAGIPGAAVPAEVVRDSDAVVVASHGSTHAEPTLARLAADTPVLCEKPLAPTVAECARIVGADRGRGLVTLGFLRRFDPAHLALRAAIAEVGEPLVVHCVSRNVSSAPGSTSESSVTTSWVDGLRAGSPSPLASAQDGLRATAVADAVVASMKDGGRTVAVAG